MNWQLEPTEQFERDARRYAKKQPREYLAVMENLEKYLISLEESSHPGLVQFGFLHDEPKGIRAVDQSGGALASGGKRGKLTQTRLYTYAALESKVLRWLQDDPGEGHPLRRERGGRPSQGLGGVTSPDATNR